MTKTNQIVQNGTGLIRFTVPLKTQLRCSSTGTCLVKWAGEFRCGFPGCLENPIPLAQDENKQLVPHAQCRSLYTPERDLALVETD